MENATKALLIAAAVLVAIVIIAMEMGVFNSTTGTIDQYDTTMQSTELTAFNNKFTPYTGGGKSAAQVKALANIVIVHNAKNPHQQVSFQGHKDSANITNCISNLAVGPYTIIIDFDTNGYVSSITF